MQYELELSGSNEKKYSQQLDNLRNLFQVHVYLMSFQIALCITSVFTIMTLKWFFTGVNSDVLFHGGRIFHSFWTKWTPA